MGTRADNGELVGTFGDFGVTSLPDACGSIMGFLELGFSSSKCTLPAAQSHDPPLEVLSPTQLLPLTPHVGTPALGPI